MAWTKLKTGILVGAACFLIAGSTTVVLQNRSSGTSLPTAGFAGFATPEAAIESMLWAGNRGDFEGYLAGCTPAQAERMRNKMAGKSEAEVSAAAQAWARAMSGYRIDRKELVSDTEVRLHISAPPSEQGLRSGQVVVVMNKLGGHWKQAGDR